MRANFKLGSFLGVPIGLNYSWFITLVVITVFFGLQIFPLMLPNEARAVQWGLALATAVAFFISVMIHEFAHALVARALGVPVRGIILFIFGGVAQIEREARSWTAELTIALVGPLTSFVLTALFLGLWIATGSSDSTGSIVWEWLWLINLAVGLINLIPVMPFDGGRMLRAIIWGISGTFTTASAAASVVGQVLSYALVAIGLLSLAGLAPFDLGALAELWLILIGLFLEGAARNSHQQVRVADILGKGTARDVMTRSYELVDSAVTVEHLVSVTFGDSQPGLAIVTEDSRVVGVVTSMAAGAVPGEERDERRAGQIMTNAAEIPVAEIDEQLSEVVARMDRENLVVIPVIEDQRLAGLISRTQIDRLVDGGGS
jgi:Zn-dependent protease/CBS domain-containing protein